MAKMVKSTNIIASCAVALLALVGCRDEKELTIIDKNTPVKVSALYMFGTANYTDWDYNNPTPMRQSESNVYSYHGPLRKGAFKIGTTVGDSYQAFIHPLTDGEVIGEEKIVDKAFQTPRYGGEDECWQIDKDGVYKLEFNILTQTYSSVYEGMLNEWDSPIESNAVYIVGTSVDVSWELANAQQMLRDANDPYLFTWTGTLMPGSLRFALNNSTWEYPVLRPESDKRPVGKDKPLEGDRVRFTSDVDDNWKVTDPGNYTLTVNLRDLVMSARYNSPCDLPPVDRDVTVYLFGDATPAGWALGAGVNFDYVEGSDYVYTWEGWLNAGWMMFMLENETWNKRIRPTVANSPVGATPVFEEFMYPNPYDTNWLVQFPGDYRLTVDLRKCTISTEFIVPQVDELYVYGDASAAGWNIGQGLPMAPVPGADQVFAWQGRLQRGLLLFSFVNDSWDKMIRPQVPDSPVGPEADVNETFIYPLDKDHNWLVTAPGEYRLVVDIPNRTFKAQYMLPQVDRLYVYGDATAAGWDLGSGLEMLPVPGKDRVYSWEGHLNPGWLLFSFINDGWDKMIRPQVPDSPVGPDPVVDQKFIYPINQDNNWLVKAAGTYRLTIDLSKRTFGAQMTATD